MFSFQNLSVYQKTIKLNEEVFEFFKKNRYIDFGLQDQLKRACVSVALNIAEGSGRLSKADKNRFYTISRASAYEMVAALELIFKVYKLDKKKYYILIRDIEEICKMLFGLMNKTESKIFKFNKK